jgi:pimeloyl-ACP methyl ester carboxylesterase
MAIKPGNVVTLKDGRVLGYAEWGDPAGAPVFHFHGSPSSRLECASPDFDAVAAEIGVRVIAPDRPGIGLSDPKPRRRILDWPSDMLELADSLGISRFCLYGVSGGSPYAAACAYRIPHRLRAAGIVSGLAPMDRREGRGGMSRPDRLLFFCGRNLPTVLRRIVRRMANQISVNSTRTIANLLDRLPEADRRYLDDPLRQKNLVASTRESFRRGEEGAYLDLLLASNGWGFEPAQVPIVMNLWFGGQDTRVPPAVGRFLAKTFPRSEARFYPDEGHHSLIGHRYQEILGGLLATAKREGDKPIMIA